MNKGFFKGLITGIALTLVFALALTVGAEVFKAKIDVVYRDIKVLVDGKKIDCRNGKGENVEPFIVVDQGTTYVPLRSFTEAVGIGVEWDDKTSTIYLGEKPSTGELVSAADLVAYRGDNFRKGQEFTFRQKKFTTQNSLYNDEGYFLIGGDYIKFTAKAVCPDNSSSGIVNIYDVDDMDEPIFSLTSNDLQKFGEIVDVEVDIIGVDKIRIWSSGAVLYDAYFTPIKKR